MIEGIGMCMVFLVLLGKYFLKVGIGLKLGVVGLLVGCVWLILLVEDEG